MHVLILIAKRGISEDICLLRCIKEWPPQGHQILYIPDVSIQNVNQDWTWEIKFKSNEISSQTNYRNEYQVSRHILLHSYCSLLREESGLLSTVGSPVVFCSFSGGEGPLAEYPVTTKQIKIMHVVWNISVLEYTINAWNIFYNE